MALSTRSCRPAPGRGAGQARKIAEHTPLVVQATKHFADQSLSRGPLARAYPRWMRSQAIMGREDHDEAAEAFREKRKPRFKVR